MAWPTLAHEGDGPGNEWETLHRGRPDRHPRIRVDRSARPISPYAFVRCEVQPAYLRRATTIAEMKDPDPELGPAEITPVDLGPPRRGRTTFTAMTVTVGGAGLQTARGIVSPLTLPPLFQ
jgi:hypothetical protein